jgi:hypothetical protein
MGPPVGRPAVSMLLMLCGGDFELLSSLLDHTGRIDIVVV